MLDGGIFPSAQHVVSEEVAKGWLCCCHTNKPTLFFLPLSPSKEQTLCRQLPRDAVGGVHQNLERSGPFIVCIHRLSCGRVAV